MTFVDEFLAERDRKMAEDFASRAVYVRPAVLKRLGLRLWVHSPSERSLGEVHLVRLTGTSMLGMPEYVKVCWAVRPSWRGEVVLRRDERGTPLTCRKCQTWLAKR